MLLHNIEAVFLDAGNTLLAPYPDVATRYSNTARKFGANTTPELVGSRFPRLWKEFGEKRKRLLFRTDPEGTKRFWYEFVSEVFEPWKNEISDFEAFFEELYYAFASPTAWRLFDDVVPVLERLKAESIKLAIVSNWDYRLERIIEHLNIGGYFDSIVISAQIGYEKPAPEIFQYAMESVGVRERSRILHVGDSIGDDVEGALNFGIHAALILRDGMHEPNSAEGFILLRSLYDLLDVLGIDS